MRATCFGDVYAASQGGREAPVGCAETTTMHSRSRSALCCYLAPQGRRHPLAIRASIAPRHTSERLRRSEARLSASTENMFHLFTLLRRMRASCNRMSTRGPDYRRT